MINHRGEAFAQLFDAVQEGLRSAFRTEAPVHVLPAAGTGGLEAAVVNFLSPGDRVLACVGGAFGQRWAAIAAEHGARVERLEVEWGQAVLPEALGGRLAALPDLKAVLITHNETSTGVTNPLQDLARVTRQHGALLMVDAVSSLGAVPLEMDAWGLDVVVTGAQKALACPPGLAMVAASERAWAASEQARTPRHYLDLRPYRRLLPERQTPYTPAVSLWFALREGLRLLHEEGLENAWARHALLGRMARAGVRALNFGVLAPEAFASSTVTAATVPAGLQAKVLRRDARERFGVVLAGGQGKLADAILRIGHVGFIAPDDVLTAISALELTLALHGNRDALGRGTAAAQAAWLEALHA